MNSIKLNKKYVGVGNPAYIVAEIGINHNGDMDLAKKTIISAKNSGADAVKFQNYKTEDFVPNRSATYEYLSQGKIISEYQHDMFKRYELSNNQVVELKSFCDQNQIDFHSTPTNFEGVDLLKKIGVAVLKNGSDYLTNLDLIRYMGKAGIPTVLSTGMATISEIDESVMAFKESGNRDLILLHCTSSYPTPAEDVNLKKIRTLAETFGMLSGFSDHSEGAWASIASIAFGACWIEKHFTLDKKLPGPDHGFSSAPSEFRSLVEGVRFVEKSLGVAQLGPTEKEKSSRANYRLSCATNKALKAGDVIGNNDIVFLRPGTGIPPKLKDIIIGKKVRHSIEAFKVLEKEDFLECT